MMPLYHWYRITTGCDRGPARAADLKRRGGVGGRQQAQLRRCITHTAALAGPPRAAPRTQSTSSTGCACPGRGVARQCAAAACKIDRVGPSCRSWPKILWLEIPSRGLTLPQNLGRPCAVSLARRHRTAPRPGFMGAGALARRLAFAASSRSVAEIAHAP
jgi:hypothetical protein